MELFQDQINFFNFFTTLSFILILYHPAYTWLVDPQTFGWLFGLSCPMKITGCSAFLSFLWGLLSIFYHYLNTPVEYKDLILNTYDLDKWESTQTSLFLLLQYGYSMYKYYYVLHVCGCVCACTVTTLTQGLYLTVTQLLPQFPHLRSSFPSIGFSSSYSTLSWHNFWPAIWFLSYWTWPATRICTAPKIQTGSRS